MKKRQRLFSSTRNFTKHFDAVFHRSTFVITTSTDKNSDNFNACRCLLLKLTNIVINRHLRCFKYTTGGQNVETAPLPQIGHRSHPNRISTTDSTSSRAARKRIPPRLGLVLIDLRVITYFRYDTNSRYVKIVRRESNEYFYEG